MITRTSTGFIAEDLEESVVAPGGGQAVYSIACDVIALVTDVQIASYIYNNPQPGMP